MDALLEVHKKNQETVYRSFKGEAGFVASLDKVIDIYLLMSGVPMLTGTF